MGVEVERKFLVSDESWRDHVTSSTRIVQGYIAQTDSATVRVRVRADRGFLTIKGVSSGVSRTEFEYEVPVADALAMLDELAQGPVIDKVRHLVPVGGHVWEVDVFAGENAPLVMVPSSTRSATWSRWAVMSGRSTCSPGRTPRWSWQRLSWPMPTRHSRAPAGQDRRCPTTSATST
jgi:adenylate cyclase